MSAFPSSMHMHTHFGDGQNSPEEMILSAISLGFVSIGFAEHAWASHDLDVCIPQNKVEAYRNEVMRLKEKYTDQIEVSCGLEVDSYGLCNKSGWDHIVGSVHYVRSKKTGKYYNVDYRPEIFRAGVQDAGGGSVQSFIEQYGENILQIIAYQPDMIGHIDVVSKLNRKERFFSENESWYKAMWEAIVAAVAKSGCVTEINTGGMARGYTDQPFPSHDLLRMLCREGAPLTLCSDAHTNDPDLMNYGFADTLTFLREIGYNSVKLWRGGKFVDFPI